MSKVSFSRELLGTIRFIFDKTKSRTLNATQAYDISTSQIVLGSFPASATKKLLTKDLGFLEPDIDVRLGSAAVTLTASGEVTPGTVLGKADRKAAPAITASISATVSWASTTAGGSLTKNKKSLFFEPANTATFGGTSAVLLTDGAKKSNATKDIFYGAITVGTGDYRAWQGKYAVLKVDLLTNNAILRVYNE